MKYNHLNTSTLKCFKFPELDGGNDAKTNQNNCLCDSLNLWYKNGRLQTRPGLCPKNSNVISVLKHSDYDEFEYCLHDVTVNYLETEYKIGTIGVSSDNFMYTLYIYFMASEYNVLPVGSLNFLRISSDNFKIPENIIFYTGKPQIGGGVFAFVTLKNVENLEEKSYNIYEINSNFTGWERVYDYYIPTVLINGRGNNYDIARAQTYNNLPNPKTLESQNLLNGRFYAYYTSDGYSNTFRLPVSDLSYDSVICRIYYTSSLYVEWKVSGQSILDTQNFMGSEVAFMVDHEKGMISFTKDGIDYPIPVMSTYSENNIRITATKKSPDGFAQVIDSTCSLTADGRLYLAGGKNGNQLIMCKGDNPLYFPQVSTVDVGGTEPITALSIQNRKIIAFKNNESYCVSLNKGDKINEISLLADNDKLFVSDDRLYAELISKSVGCRYKSTVCKVGDQTVWQGQDGEVYTLEGVGFDRVVKLTDSLHEDAEFEYMDAFAVSDGCYYILVSGNKAVACDLTKISNPKIYLWNFGNSFKLCGGFYRNAKLWFWCYEGNSGISYVASLTAENDLKVYYDEDGQIKSEIVKIKGFVKTIDYSFSGHNHKNVVESIYIALAGRGKVELKVNGKRQAMVDLRFSTDDYDKGEYKTVRLRPHLYDTEKVGFEISSDSHFAVGDIEIFYRKTN